MTVGRATKYPASDHRTRAWSSNYSIQPEGLRTTPIMKTFLGFHHGQHAYCMAHGYANIIVDVLSFLCNVNHKEMTAARRIVNAENLPHIRNAGDELPWLPLRGKIKQFEAMLARGLVASDVGDGNLRSPIPTKSGTEKPAVRKGIKFAHKFHFLGPLGFCLLEYVFPNTSQRNFVRDLFDYMSRGLARQFTTNEIDSLERKGRALERVAERVMPKDFMTIVVHMCLRHLGDTIRKWGPLTESWTMFVEREIRTLKNRTNSNGRDARRIALADSRWREAHDHSAPLPPLPSYSSRHPTGSLTFIHK